MTESRATDGRRRFSVAAGFLVLALLFALAACGGGEDEEGTPPAAETPAAAGTPEATVTGEEEGGVATGEIDPCALVTKEEVEAVLGASVDEPTREIAGPLASCRYTVPDGDYVSVFVFTSDDKDEVAAFFELGGENWEPVAGLGDDAYWAAPFHDLEVLVDGYDVGIVVYVGDKDELAVAKELAEKALDRLP